MKTVCSLFILSACLLGCTVDSTDQYTPSHIQYVKSNCNNEAMYLDLLHAHYSFPVMCVSNNSDTIDLNQNILLRTFTISDGDLDNSIGDSIRKVEERSAWRERALWDHIDLRYPPLDSFSLVLDTSHEVCSSFFTVDNYDEEPVRREFTRFYPLLIQNLSNDTSQILEYSGVGLEILNKNNKWELALNNNLMCLTGVASFWIAPKETIVVLIPITKGTHTRTMRVKFRNQYSISFQANCNYKY